MRRTGREGCAEREARRRKGEERGRRGEETGRRGVTREGGEKEKR